VTNNVTDLWIVHLRSTFKYNLWQWTGPTIAAHWVKLGSLASRRWTVL